MTRSVEDILALNAEAFGKLVDEDVRDQADTHDAELLRTPELAERWYAQLVKMKKSVESTIAAKSLEDKEQRITLISAAAETSPEVAKDLRRRADGARAAHLKWKTGALRFRAGVEERLCEAAWRRRAAGAYIPVALLDERNALLRRVGDLEDAIATHRSAVLSDDDDVADAADARLWEILGGRA